MKVPVALLKVWLCGITAIPDSAFLDAVDVITSATTADIARCREAMRRSDHPSSK